MSLEFIVAADNEIAELNSSENLTDLLFKYEIVASGANGFQDFKLLSKFFGHSENYVPKEVIKTVNYSFENKDYAFKVYCLEKEFFEKIVNFDRADLDNADSVEFWQSRGYFSMAIWNCVHGVHNLCKIAISNNRNLYLVEFIG